MRATHTNDDAQAWHRAARYRLIQAWARRLGEKWATFNYVYDLGLRSPIIEVVPLGGKWGRWDRRHRVISICPSLIENYPWLVVCDVLKHEMAHQVVDEVYRGGVAHGPLFRQVCKRLALPGWAAAASGELPTQIPDWRQREEGDEDLRVLRRAERLMALTRSANEHEAMIAMQRVQELQARYNIDQLRRQAAGEHVVALICRQKKRLDFLDRLIGRILVDFFHVKAIIVDSYDPHEDAVYRAFEICGRPHCVTMAEYVFAFLRRSCEELWADFRREAGRGRGSRSSYMEGLISGFRDKLKAANPEATWSDEEQALVAVADSELEAFYQTRNPRTRTVTRGPMNYDPEAYARGECDGASLNIAPPVERSQDSGRLLS